MSVARFAACFLCFSTVLCSGVPAVATSPNIVVIYADDQGWTSSSVQMDPNIPESKSDFIQTPRLEQLAAEGMRFSSAYAAPDCSPSRAALQTGKSPAQLQMTDVSAAAKYDNSWYGRRYEGYPLTPPIQPRNLDFDQDTIAEHLKEVAPSYKSANFLKWHVSRDVHANDPIYGYDYTTVTHSSLEYGPGGDPKQIFSVTDTANDFMEDRVNAGEPFYLQISHAAPHNPFEARPDTLDKYNNLPPGTRHDDPEFAAMVEDLDTGVGMVLDKIEQLGIKDNTYVVYISDNGGIAALGTGVNTPLYQTKGTVFEGGVRVPMIVSGPGIEPGSVSRVPVTIQDIFATVSDLVGSDAPLEPDLESASLTPLLFNGGQLPAGMDSLQRGFAPNGEIFFHSPHNQAQPTGFTNRSPQSGVRDGDYKLVKVYGENGQPDKVFLYNLAQNVTETEDPNSPLNLANQMPGKTAELLAKLDKWLQDVDASLPYQVWDDIELRWDAGSPGSDPTAWRSTIDVDNYWRERWEPGLFQVGPTRVAAESHQPKLADQAIHFDGGQGLTRQFFHVSDNKLPDVYDADHSATFEFWVRTEDLTQNQLLFETGDAYAGLSVTLGDGDGDGAPDDVRVRVRGGVDGGQQSLVITSELNKFADPTEDFVQVSVVVSDDDNDRYLELYVNGALFGRADGVAGPGGRLSWDDWNVDLDLAGLGMLAGDDIGGTGGVGDQPFTTANFRGEIALIRYFNYALSSSTIQSHYNEVLYPVDFGIHSVAGQAGVPVVRPTNVSLNAEESSSLMVVQERSDTLDDPLDVDAVISGPITLDAVESGTMGALAAGTSFTSYLLQFDPASNNGSIMESVAGSVQFSQEILAILFDPASLANGDALLGAIGDYGLESDRGVLLDGGDILTISSDRRTLSFDLSIAGDEQLQFRVLTDLALAADFDNSGTVDALDLAVWEAAYGVNADADADFDGDSDGDDFLVWQRQVDSGSPIASSVSVPEPATALMALAMCLCVACRRERICR